MKKNNIHLLVISIMLTLLVIISGLFLPQLLLEHYSGSQTGIVTRVSSENYIGKNSAISAMASSQLSEYERIQLITNSWDGESTKVNASFSEKDANYMYKLTKDCLHKLYLADLYPVSVIEESGDNWYNWKAKRYCCTDSTFNTFKAYYWVMNLYRYDGTESHTVIISEEGTIIYAECTTTATISASNIAGNYEKLSIMKYAPHSYVSLNPDSPIPDYREIKIPDGLDSIGVILIGENNVNTKEELENVYSSQNSSILSSYEYYYIFQGIEDMRNWKTIENSGKMKYTFGITPYKAN